jgi:hypothetical protein
LWALNDGLLREVIVRALEQRAQVRQTDGELLMRLKRAQDAIRAQRKYRITDFWRLQRRFLRRKRPECKLRIRREIENLDTYLRTTANDGGAALMAAVVYFYHRCGLDSVEVGRETGIKPPHVRQLLYKLNRIAKALPPEIFP